MPSFATPQALYRLRHRGDVTIALCNAQCWRPLHWSTGSHWSSGSLIRAILLYRGFSEFYRLSTASLDCRTIVAVSTSVQIRQAPSTFHPEHQENVCWSHGTAGLAVLRVVTELYMIERDLFQLSWLISWLTTGLQHGILPAYPYVRVIPLLIKGHERTIIRLVP